MKHIVVTGTSRGIGKALVELLLESGHKVMAITRQNDVFKHITNKNLIEVKAEITQDQDLQEIKKLVESQWGRIDALIHNAGRLIHKPFFKTSTDYFLEVYKVNVFAVAELTRVLLPYLHKGSHVVAISSMGGIQGSMKFAGLSAYSSSKGAVITLMELLAEEYKNSGISFNTLALGAVQTEMLNEAFPDYKAPITAQGMAKYIAEFALNGHEIYNGKVLQVSNSTP